MVQDVFFPKKEEEEKMREKKREDSPTIFSTSGLTFGDYVRRKVQAQEDLQRRRKSGRERGGHHVVSGSIHFYEEDGAPQEYHEEANPVFAAMDFAGPGK